LDNFEEEPMSQSSNSSGATNPNVPSQPSTSTAASNLNMSPHLIAVGAASNLNAPSKTTNKSRASRYRFRALGGWFIRLSARHYVYIYAAMVLLFAVIYYFMPNSFYHSTSKYEAVLDRDAEALAKDIKEAIVRAFREEHGSEKIIKDGV